MYMELLRKIEKKKDVWFLLITSFIFFIFRLPSLFEPYWYGDEGIYGVIGNALNQGRLLYRDIWDNKPPLLYETYALFHSNQSVIRFASLVCSLASVIVFFYLAKKLFKNPSLVFILTSCISFVLATPLLEGNIANAENFMMLPILISAYLVFTTKSIQNIQHLLLAGLFLGIAFLYKIVAIFDFVAFGIFLFFISYKNVKEIKAQAISLSPFIFSFLVPFLLTCFFFFAHGALNDALIAMFISNVSYVGYANHLFIAQGLLVCKLVILFCVILILFFKRSSIARSSLFILSWFAFSLFNAFFSGRPYTHYVLVLLPSFFLFIGVCFSQKNRFPFWLIPAISLILLGNYFSYWKKTPFYYQNYVEFLAGTKSVSSYQSFFDRIVPRDYQLAQFIRLHTRNSDQIFLWGNSAHMYTLSGKLPPGKFIVAYHASSSIANRLLTQIAFQKTKPRYIIILPKQPPLPFSLQKYNLLFTFSEARIYEKNP